MAITVEDNQSGTAANGGNVTLNFTALENDYVVVIGGFPRAGAAASPVPSGYTSLSEYNGTTQEWGISYKKMGATPDTSVECAGTTVGTDSTAYVCYVLRGVDGTTPSDATPVQAAGETTDGTPFNGPAITTVTDGALVISAGFDSHNVSAVTGATVAPTGYSNLANAKGADTRDCTAAAATKIVSTAGAEDPGAFTDDYDTAERFEITVAFRPAAVAGGSSTSPNALRINASRGNLGTNMTTR